MADKLRVPVPELMERFGDGHEEYYFHCPGCRGEHRITVRWGATSGRTEPQWSFNGDRARPTFKPSLLVQYTFHCESGDQKHVCHSYITDGQIQFSLS